MRFSKWLEQQAGRDDLVGDLARRVAADENYPRRTTSLPAYRDYLSTCDIPADTMNTAFKEYSGIYPPKPLRPKKPRRSAPARPETRPWPMHKHGCERQHRTYASLVRCRWPNLMQVFGEGPWGVKIESCYHQYASGKAAYWPRIYLFETEGQARDFYDQDHFGARSVQIFEMPDDPSAAEYDGLPFTQEGNRLRYAA